MDDSDNDSDLFDDMVGSDPEEDDNSDTEPDERVWLNDLECMRRNDNAHTTSLHGKGEFACIQNMTDEDWEQLGRDISNSRILTSLSVDGGALNDHKMSCLFRGLTISSSMKDMQLYNNDIGVVGVRSMVPFLQNANNLKELDLDRINLQSEGFNVLFRALRDSPIEELDCSSCCIESIDIDSEHIPKHLENLLLQDNSINAEGCRGLAKLLQGGDATLRELELDDNEINDACVEILVEALQSNTSLTTLYLRGNSDISSKGLSMLLKLVNDISSIEATLQSNHTLGNICIMNSKYLLGTKVTAQKLIDRATAMNMSYKKGSVGREKVYQTQLHSETRAKLAQFQGVQHSTVYNEIDPLHLPEVLLLIGARHGLNKFYIALSSSIMALLSTVNRKKCIKQQMEYHAAAIAEHTAKLEELSSELGVIEASEGPAGNDDEVEHRSNKRRRNEN